MSQITVFKLDLLGEITREYRGTLLRRGPHRLRLEAFFDVGDVAVADAVLRKGDRFVESFHDDRMYNVFQIFDRRDGELKGWYCNISRPAVLAAASVEWADLALDLWVGPDGKQVVLDRAEFEALDISADEREQALSALGELQRRFRRMGPPR